MARWTAGSPPAGPARRQPGRRLLALRDRVPLSGRGHDRVLRLARTIADLDGRDLVAERDLDEALSYRLDAWQRAEA